MRTFIEAFYRYRNHPDFVLEDNPMSREMGFAVGEQHWRISITELMRFEVNVDPEGLPEIHARLRENQDAFYQDFMEARRRYAVRYLRDHNIIRTGETWPEVKHRQQRAEECARQLLLEFLTEAQRKTLEEKHYFDVRGPDGELFRIEDAAHSNVYLLDDDEKELARFCGLVYGVPRSDSLLAQKLTLETQPQVFMDVANPVPATIEDYVPPQVPDITEEEAIEGERRALERRAELHNNNERFEITPEEIERLREETHRRDFENRIIAMQGMVEHAAQQQQQGDQHAVE